MKIWIFCALVMFTKGAYDTTTAWKESEDDAERSYYIRGFYVLLALIVSGVGVVLA